MGGTTFSRCAGGNYIRARTKPVNPRSPLQIIRRSNVGFLTRYWSETLTEQQRTDWRAYCTGTTWTNKLGETIQINGLAAFLRLNALRLIVGYAVSADAPTAMGHAGGNTITFAAHTDTNKIQIDEPVGAFDTDVPGHMMCFFQGIPSEPGRIATPKGFKYIGYFHSTGGGTPAFPVELTSAYTMQDDQRITLRSRFRDDKDRVSGPFWATATAAPSI